MALDHLISSLGYMKSQERYALAHFGIEPRITATVQTFTDPILDVHASDGQPLADEHNFSLQRIFNDPLGHGKLTYRHPNSGKQNNTQTGPAAASASPVASSSPSTQHRPQRSVATPTQKNTRGPLPSDHPGRSNPVARPSGTATAAGPVPMPASVQRTQPARAAASASDAGSSGTASDYTDASGDLATTAATATAADASGGGDAPAASKIPWKWIAVALGAGYLLLKR